MNGDDRVGKLREIFRQKRLLLKSGRFEQLESFLDDIYGADTDQRHAEACEILWEKGERDKAIEEVFSRLKAGEYTISHIFLAARFTHHMKRKDLADFLWRNMSPKIEEESSKMLIEYVFRNLNGMPINSEIENNAKLFLHNY